MLGRDKKIYPKETAIAKVAAVVVIQSGCPPKVAVDAVAVPPLTCGQFIEPDKKRFRVT